MFAGVAMFVARDFFGSPLGNYVATMLPPFWAKIEHPIGALDHVEVVFDDDHCVTIAP
jgi:hypothetical protein